MSTEKRAFFSTGSVRTDEIHPYLPDGMCVPLTDENDSTLRGNFKQSGDPLDRFEKSAEDLRKIFSLPLRMLQS